MGVALTRFLLLLVAALVCCGCGRISDETVRDKDQQRIETSKLMPGNNVPPDPADER